MRLLIRLLLLGVLGGRDLLRQLELDVLRLDVALANVRVAVDAVELDALAGGLRAKDGDAVSIRYLQVRVMEK